MPQSYKKKSDFSNIRQISGYTCLILEINQEEVRTRLALSRNYIKHIPMFREYMDMMEKGEKKTYVLNYLADRYQMHPDSVKRVIVRMLRTITV
jgi:hypothetical protein